MAQMRKRYTTRSETNRRSENSRIRFPVKMESGEVVLRDRRLSPDRRHPGLKTQEVKISSEEFDQLFELYSQHA